MNYFFIAVFTTECVCKLIALKKLYFNDNWNIFDFIIVVATDIILIFTFFNLGNFAIQATIVRALRLGRLLKVLKGAAKKLQVIISTLNEAAPSLASLGTLLILLIFMYSIIGMKLFGFLNIN